METCGSTTAESICIPGKQLHVDAGISYNSHQVKEMSSSMHEHAVKARKPYTITKQRERWSEEEHDKFLEALKLYGRAWRQIEEHIGTKTAVQIRSHAQKFFSKVAHDFSAADGSASVQTIAIPPPRPKRKPVHPYPRKIGHPHNLKMPIPEQAEWSYAPMPLPLEQENRSPTSVLTAFPSVTVGSSVSNLPSGPTSPLSSRAGSNHVGMFNVGENQSQLPVASSEEEDRSPSPGLNNATMESDMGVEDNVPREEDSSMETHAQATTLKLFGRTVLVTDSMKHSWSDGVSLQHPRPSGAIDIQSHHRTVDISPQTEAQAQAPSILQKIDRDVSRFPGQSAWIPWHGQIIPMVYCTPCGDSTSATEGPFGSCANSAPWCWALYGAGASPFEFSNVQSMSCIQDPCSQQGGSWNESASPSSPTEPFPPTSLRHSANSAFSSFTTGVSKSPRGFKPYKRCVSQKVVQNFSTDLAGDSEAIELCL